MTNDEHDLLTRMMDRIDRLYDMMHEHNADVHKRINLIEEWIGQHKGATESRHFALWCIGIGATVVVAVVAVMTRTNGGL